MTRHRDGLVTLGETMGLFRPSVVGAGELIDSYHLSIGGAESNVAIGIARLGGRARWIGRLGADAIGRRVQRELRAEGVDLSCTIDPGAGTGIMVKEHRIPGRSAVHYARAWSAGSRLCAADIDEVAIREAAVLHVTGITPALSASAAAAVEAAIDTAHAAGTPVSFDVNFRASLWHGRDAGQLYRRMAARASIVFAGEDEAALLVGEGSPAALAARVAELGPGTVVIKRGSAGALALSDGELAERGAVPVAVVDTVGAGDGFVAGYLSEMLAGRSGRECLDLAVRAGAFACLSRGDWEGYARRDELSLLDDSDPVTR